MGSAMADRLSALDVSFLYLEGPTTPMHVGAVALFEPGPEGLTYDDVLELIADRIALVPRFRQKIRQVPGGIANPVWVDDASFDLTYHVRRSAVPRPGSMDQLRELTARIIARRLDRSRPLWEIYVVEGLADGRIALLSKTHHAMIDGIGAMDIGQVILDRTPERRPHPQATWRAQPEPSDAELITQAVAEVVARPTALLDSLRHSLDRTLRSASLQRAAQMAGGMVSALQTVRHPPEHSPLNQPIGQARRFATATSSLADIKQIKQAFGGSINDVVLTIVAGALRTWLIDRGLTVDEDDRLRALVPVSVRADQSAGNAIASFLVDLPIGMADPVKRLAAISAEMHEHKRTGQMVGAEALVAVASFTPSTVHALGARVVNQLTDRLFNLLVTNVPGPQFPLYAAGARMVAAYPVVPLALQQTVAVGVSSYDGGMFWGITADRDGAPDADRLADAVTAAVADLLTRAQQPKTRSTRRTRQGE